MTANELADLIEDVYPRGFVKDAADLLRQQQAEIEALKKEAALQRLSDFTQEADNEPVAWYYENKNGVSWVSGTQEKHDKNFVAVEKPIYTHPAKTLTDFEIKGVLALDECWIGEDSSMPNMIAFARAILRKVEEK